MKSRSLLTLVMLCLVAGCSSDSGEKTASTELSYIEGSQAFDNQQYEDADALLTKAIQMGAMNVDMMCDARLKRARSRMEINEFDGAREDLDYLLEGAPDTTPVLAALGDLALREGETDEARRLYAEARKSNPRLELPSQLR